MLSLVFLVLIGIMSYFLYEAQRIAAYDEFRQIGDKLGTQAQANVNLIQPLAEAVDLNAKTPQNEADILKRLLDAMTDDDLMTNAYYLSKKPVDKEDGTYLRNVLVSESLSSAGSKIGDEYNTRGAMLASYKIAVNGKADLSGTYTDDFGTWITYMAPIVDGNGKTVAVFGLDFNYSKVEHKLNVVLLQAIAAGQVVALVAIAIVLLLVRVIVRPLRALAATAKEAAQGNLTVTVPAYGANEIGQASDAFNEMIASLRGLTVHIKQTAQEVTASSGNLRETANQTALATNEVTHAIQQVAEGTQTQLISAEESLRAMTEMSIGIQRIAESSSAVSDKAAETTEQAIRGERVIARTVEQMRTIEDQVGHAAEMMEHLNESNGKIGDILAHIADVANQTNLLALNASIEAARAGEHGKGFAVVAQEIRKLAERSKASSQEISEILHAIGGKAQEVNASLNASADQARIGSELAQTSGESFLSILDAVKHVSEQVQEVSAASEEMSAGSEQITASLEESSRIAETASSHSQQVAAASEEQLASVEEVAGAATQLQSLANELSERVSRFRV